MKEKRSLLKCIPYKMRNDILDYLKDMESTSVKNDELLTSLNLDMKSYRKLEDMLNYLTEVEGLLVKGKVGRAYEWRLKNKDYLNKEMSEKDAVNLEYIIELNRNEYDKDMVQTLKKLYSANSNIKGLLSIAESFENERLAYNYDTIMVAIKDRKYIRFELSTNGIVEDVKPLKFVFVDNNWYVAFEHTHDNKKDLMLSRLSFIKEVEFLEDKKYTNKDTFQVKGLDKYYDFLEKDLQNSNTLYGVKPKTATLKATENIAKYFQKDMKKFLKTQTFMKEHKDGSIIFSIDYTQDLEILPFIQRWMPDIIILGPIELQEAYLEKLKDGVNRQAQDMQS